MSTYERSEAVRLRDLLIEYRPDDAGWKVLSDHLAEAFVRSETTHFSRAGYEPQAKSKFDRREDGRVLEAVAEVVADWPDTPLLSEEFRTPLRSSGHVISKMHLLSRGETSRAIEDAADAAEVERQAELNRQARQAVQDLAEIDDRIAQLRDEKENTNAQ
jgi:hypothetical protein